MRQGTNQVLAAAVSMACLCSGAGAQCLDFATVGTADSSIFAAVTFDEDGPGPNPPRLFIAGNFNHVGGVAAQGVARWDGATWTPVGDGLAYAGCLAVFDDGTGPALYAGGSFSTPGNHIAKWDGTTWVPLGAGVDQSVLTLTPYNDGSGPALFAGGNFTNAGGASTDHVASWNGTAWRTWTAAGPSPRLFSSMAYDAARSNMVLFGGRVGSNAVRETWTGNGTSWTLAANSGPDIRLSAPMAFDSLRSRMLMLGGSNNDTRTWAWDGSAWTMIVPTYLLGGQRTGFQMVYDEARDRMVIFGGVATYNDHLLYNDTWEFDGTTWAQVTTPHAPSVRQLYAMTYDSIRHRVVLFGGVNTLTFLGDTWEYDGSDWTQRATTGPTARQNSTMTFDSARARATLYGGLDGQNSTQTWGWNGTTWSLLDAGQPSYFSRTGAPIVYDPAHACVVQRDPTGTQWSWNGTAWSIVTGGGINGPVRQLQVHDDGTGLALYACGTFTLAGGGASPNIARLANTGWGPVADGLNGTASSMATFAGSLYVSGAFSYAGNVQVNGLARWNGSVWSPVNTSAVGLSASGSLSVASDGTGPKLYATGPAGGPNSIIQWNGAVWRPIVSPGTQPGPREFAAMAYDAARSRSVLFGGTSNGAAGGSLGDTFEWDGRAWYQVATTGPSARWGHAMAYDSDRSRTVLVGGGTAAGSANSQTWSWDGAAWTQLSPSFGTTSRLQTAITYDIARDRIVLFGGRSGALDALSDTWEWDGAAWTQRIVAGPPARYAHAMAYDSDRHRTVLTGGIDVNGLQLYDTWEWDGAQWTLLNNDPDNFTGPISNHAMAYNTVHQRTVLYGGLRGNFDSSTLWEWNGQAWTNVGSANGSARAAAYDSGLQGLVVYGGYRDNNVVDTTEVLRDAGQAPGLGTLIRAINFDDGSGPAVFMIGTQIGNSQFSVAKWGAPCSAPVITTQPASQTTLYGQTLTFSVETASGTAPLSYQWRRNGINLHDVNNYIFGSISAQLHIVGWSLNDAGQYDVVISGPGGSVISDPAVLTVSGSVPGSPVTVTRIAYPPEPVPGSPGLNFIRFSSPMIAPTGEIVFFGQIPPSNGWGLCLWDNGILQVLFKAYDTIAGAAPSEYIDPSGGIQHFGLMPGRRLWFTADLGGPGVDVTNRRALWYWDDTTTQMIARRGTQPTGYSAGNVFSQYGDIYPSANSVGDIIYSSWVDNPTGTRTGGAVWLWNQSAGQTVMARYGDPAPGTTGTIGFTFDDASINAEGEVAIDCRLSSSRTVVWTGSPTSLTPVLLSNNPPPGLPAGAVFEYINVAAAINSAGQVLLSGVADNPTGPPTGVVYRTSPSGLQIIVKTGMPAPGAPPTDPFDYATPWGMNDQGDVLFFSSLHAICDPPTCPNAGLWLAAADGIHPIVLTNTTPPVGTPSIFTNCYPYNLGVVNNSGIVAFEARLSGPQQSDTYGVYGWTPTDGAFAISVPGTQMEVRPGIFKTVSQCILSQGLDLATVHGGNNLNDAGTLVMQVSFTDNSNGIFEGQFGDFLVGRFPCRVFVSPQVQTVPQGQVVTFAASAAGQGATFRWQHNDQDLSDNGRISGAASALLVINSASLSDAGSYTCVVTNSCGQATSPTATLTVTSHCGTADFNCDGDTGTDQDIEAFFACLSGICPAPPCSNSADFNRDGDIGTDQDIEAFFRVLSGGAC